MIILTLKKRDDTKALLEGHQKVSDALAHVRRATWYSTLSVTHDDGNEDVIVELHYQIAERSLKEQKTLIEKELSKIGITMVNG